MKILITNIHSLENAGDAALLWATMDQLHTNFPGCQITLAINFPNTFDRYIQALEEYQPAGLSAQPLTVVGSFMYWAKKQDRQGNPAWNIPALVWLGLYSLFVMVALRLGVRSDRLPLGGLSPGQSALFQAYADADLVVSVPGNFLYHSGRLGMPLLINLYSMVYAPLTARPLYIFPQSIGPLERKSEIWLTKKVLAQARIVMVRETESLRFLESVGFRHPRLQLIPDVALDFDGFPADAGIRWLVEHGCDPKVGRPLLGVTPINWWVQTRDFDFDRQRCYEAALAAVCRAFVEEMDGEVVLFTQVTGDFETERDEIAARRIKNLLQDCSEQVHLIDKGAIPHLLKAAYSQMDLFIGTRMHSNIFALTAGVPVIAIAYRYKTVGLMKLLGLEHWVVEIGQLGDRNGQQPFLELVGELYQQSAALRPKIRQRVSDLSEQSRQAGRLVAEDYARLKNV